jgi:tetratricopeptide (TPR) repeat protein
MQRVALNLLVASALNNSDKEESIAYYLELLSLPTSDTLATAGYLENIAVNYLQLHQVRTSIAYRERAAEIYRAKGLKDKLGGQLRWISSLYEQLGEYSTAERYHSQATALGAETNVNLLMDTGQYERAIQIIRENISQIRDKPAGKDETGSWLRLSEIYRQTKQQKQAIESLDEAVRVWRKKQNPALVEDLALIGAQYRELGKTEEALKLFQEYREGVLRRGPGGFPQYPAFLRAMALTERDAGLLESARAHLEEAITIRDKPWAQIASPGLRASFFSSARPIFDTYVDVLMRQHVRSPEAGYDAMAFAASERARAQSFIAGLGDTVARIKEGVPSQLIERERVLEDQLNEAAVLQRQTANSRTSSQAQTTATRIQSLTGDLELLRGQIRRASPRYASLTQPASLNLDEVRQQVLGPGVTLLEYALNADGNSYVWAVTADTLRGFPLPEKPIIDAAVRRVLELLTAPQLKPKGETSAQRQARLAKAANEYSAAAAALSRMVLRPVAEMLHGQRLLLVADGSLAYVPFAALPNPRTGQPLIASHEVVRLPSASALAVLRQEVATRGPATNRGIAVLADPVFDVADERFGVLKTQTKESYPRSTGTIAQRNESQYPQIGVFAAGGRCHYGSRASGDCISRTRFQSEPCSRDKLRARQLSDRALRHARASQQRNSRTFRDRALAGK